MSVQRTQSYCPLKFDPSEKVIYRKSTEKSDELSIKQIRQEESPKNINERINFKNMKPTDHLPQSKSITNALLLFGCAFSVLYAHFCIL